MAPHVILRLAANPQVSCLYLAPMSAVLRAPLYVRALQEMSLSAQISDRDVHASLFKLLRSSKLNRQHVAGLAMI
jgi:hypothetical protein